MRVNTNVSNKTRRELVLDDFKGVDFSSSPLKVSGSRASFASNLICDNGVNHKRPGWEQVLKLEGNINGMYEYKNGNHHVLIVYAGEVFRQNALPQFNMRTRHLQILLLQHQAGHFFNPVSGQITLHTNTL